MAHERLGDRERAQAIFEYLYRFRRHTYPLAAEHWLGMAHRLVAMGSP
jgi:hypothetical protein